MVEGKLLLLLGWHLALTGLPGLAAALFGSGSLRTVVHVGSYLLPVLGIAGAVAGLRAVLPRFALYYVGFAALLSLALYVPALNPPAGTSYSPLATVLGAAALSAFATLAFRGGRRRPGDRDADYTPAPSWRG